MYRFSLPDKGTVEAGNDGDSNAAIGDELMAGVPQKGVCGRASEAHERVRPGGRRLSCVRFLYHLGYFLLGHRLRPRRTFARQGHPHDR